MHAGASFLHDPLPRLCVQVAQIAEGPRGQEVAFDVFDPRFDDTFIDSWDQPQTYGAAILHVILHDDEHRQEILHILNRLGVENVPEIDHALWDFVRRGLYIPD